MDEAALWSLIDKKNTLALSRACNKVAPGKHYCGQEREHS
jgi:hypothetical protein